MVILRCEPCTRRRGRSRPLAVLARQPGHVRPGHDRRPWSTWRVVRVGKGDLDPDRLRPADHAISNEQMIGTPTALWPSHNAYGVARLVIDGEETVVVVPEGAERPGRGPSGTRRIALVPVAPGAGVELVCPDCPHRPRLSSADRGALAERAVAAGRRDAYV
jgi:hypothetical protein